VEFVKVPLAQSVHVFVPSALLPPGPNLPMLHGAPKHTVAPALGAYIPDSHNVHVAAAELCDPAGPNVPAAQMVPKQLVLPAAVE